MVIVLTKERRNDQLIKEEQFVAPTTGLAIDDMIRHSTMAMVRGSDPGALKSLLQLHTELALGGKGTSVEFTLLFRE